MFQKKLCLDVLMVLALTADALVHSSYFTPEGWPLHVPTGITLTLWLFFAKDEFVQICKAESFSKYLGFWNVMDFLR